VNAELNRALESQGWDSLYEEYVPGLSPVNERGERRARSPFPDSNDRTPSFSVNVINGYWRCWHSDRSGDYILFKAIMEAEEFDDNGRAVPDYSRTMRALQREFHLTTPIDPTWLRQCQEDLQRDLVAQHEIQRVKPWSLDVMVFYGIGYDGLTGRYVFPIYDRWGELINCRMYLPGGAPKWIWGNSGMSANVIWPRQGWEESSLVLVEGETDVLSLRTLGISGVSGTMGANSPIPDGRWYVNKTIFILMDVDTAGDNARETAVQALSGRCGDLRLVNLPDWDGRPEKADITDYIQHLYSQSLGFDLVRSNVLRLFENSEQLADNPVFYDQEAAQRSYSNALSATNVNQRVSFSCKITARSSSRYILPIVYTLTCPGQGHSYCRGCPMNEEHGGNGRFRRDPRSVDTLKMIQSSDEQQLIVLKAENDIPKQCPEVELSITEAFDVESVIINASVSEGIASPEEIERQRREAFLIVNPGVIIQENKEYNMEGFVYPHPKTQAGVFLIDRCIQQASIYELHTITPDSSERLRQVFSPSGDQGIFDKLLDVVDDLATSTTMIRDRTDLHLAYRTIWHTALQFEFCGSLVHKGWAECLVLGDTRTGKSRSFQEMASFYNLGVLVDCKMQTPAGMMGTVMQTASGEYYVVAGILPQQDGGIVCFDEFHVPKWQGGGIIEHLSSTRSEGIVRISKAASAEFKARVRSIWLANPGSGRLMSDIGQSGCELTQRLINQPEDIARFDFALTVTQDEVDPDMINSVSKPAEPRHSKDESRSLLSWIYSRKIDQILFDADAEVEVMEVAKRLYRKYSAVIPFVEPADQRNKVAKLSVSVAGQVYSASQDGSCLIVTREHVQVVERLFTMWYDKPSMGYDRYSLKLARDESSISVSYIKDCLQKMSGHNFKRLVDLLLSMDGINPRMVSMYVPGDSLSSFGIVPILSANHCIAPSKAGKSDFFDLTPAFSRILKGFQYELENMV
jgi:hypothetical protein